MDNAIVCAKDRVKALVRTLYYLKDAKLHYRVIQPLTDDVWGPARFSEEKESSLNIVATAGGAIAITASPCGRFLAVISRDSATVEIRSIKTRQVLMPSRIAPDSPSLLSFGRGAEPVARIVPSCLRRRFGEGLLGP